MFGRTKLTLPKNSRLYYASLIGVILAFLWGGLLDYWGQTSPTHLEELSGKIYPMNFHGTVVYLNLTQEILRYALPAAVFLEMILLAIIFPTERKQKILTEFILRDLKNKK